jgi:hypothetical protein
MIVNNYKILNKPTDIFINIPIEVKWDIDGNDDAIDQFVLETIDEVIGKENDFEIARFSHKKHDNTDRTDINYDFGFFDSSSNLWNSSYLTEGFSVNEVYYYTKPFTKSFFKLDFYDTKDSATQKNYLTVILPVQQGKLQNGLTLSPSLPSVNIKKPEFVLDFIGDKEGFFLYWVRSRDFINIDTFYMRAKFFNGKTGSYVIMTNTQQTSMLPTQYNFDPAVYFYYEVNLDYSDFTYVVKDNNGNRVGTTTPINWYEYINP